MRYGIVLLPVTTCQMNLKMLDNGFPLTTELNVLQDLIKLVVAKSL